MLAGLAGCAAPLAFIPVTPLLAGALSSRSSDLETRKRIIELQSRNDWAGLEQLALQQLKLSPDGEEGLLLLAYSRLQLRKYAEAEDTLSLMTRLYPEEVNGWNLLGEAQRRMGRPDQALRTLVHARSIDPSSAVSPFLMGETYRDQRRLDNALASYQQSVELDPEMTLAWYGLGITLKRSGQTEELAKVVQMLQKLDAGLAAQLATLN